MRCGRGGRGGREGRWRRARAASRGGGGSALLAALCAVYIVFVPHPPLITLPFLHRLTAGYPTLKIHKAGSTEGERYQGGRDLESLKAAITA